MIFSTLKNFPIVCVYFCAWIEVHLQFAVNWKFLDVIVFPLSSLLSKFVCQHRFTGVWFVKYLHKGGLRRFLCFPGKPKINTIAKKIFREPFFPTWRKNFEGENCRRNFLSNYCQLSSSNSMQCIIVSLTPIWHILFRFNICLRG